MKIPSLLTVALLIAGCTSMQPIDGSPADLRLRINSGELLKTGDRVLIVTRRHIASPSSRLEQVASTERRSRFGSSRYLL